LASHFRTLDAFLSATAEEIGQVDGIGSGMTADIMAYKTTHEADIRELAKAVNIVNPDDEVSSFNSDDLAGIPKGAPNCLAGLTFCVTGKVDFPGARNALAEYIKSLGGKFGTSVTKNTDYLITNTPNSGSAKNQNAQKLGVKVIPESAFYLLVEELSKKVTASAEPASAEPEKEMTQGEKIVKAGVDAVVIPEDPREARIQAANVLQAFSGVPLAGLTFCVTGKVNYGTREAFFRLIESNGGKTATSMTRGVDYLITNDPYSGSNKNRRARELGAKVISEREFFEMLNRV
jgi:NAD-dependent DNA ligase